MMLRMMILRRKTDPKTGDHTLCKPVQSKCTWTFDKSHFEREFTGKMPRVQPPAPKAGKQQLKPTTEGETPIFPSTKHHPTPISLKDELIV